MDSGVQGVPGVQGYVQGVQLVRSETQDVTSIGKVQNSRCDVYGIMSIPLPILPCPPTNLQAVGHAVGSAHWAQDLPRGSLTLSCHPAITRVALPPSQ